MNPGPLVEAEGIVVRFGSTEALKGVDIALGPGEVHGLVGENGAGKSTLGKVIAGVVQPTSGEVRVGGVAPGPTSPKDALSKGIALIHQEPLTFPDLSVAENVFIGHQPTGALGLMSWAEMRRKAQALLDSLGVRLRPDALVRGLSIADQQMVELAAALSHDARVLIMDETTASITPNEVAQLFGIVRRLRDSGCAIAFVSHRLEEIFEICDRVTVLRDGAKIGERKISDTNVGEVVHMMVGRSVESLGFPSEREPGEALLEVRGLTLRGAFQNIDFTLRAGEIVGLAGLVGAGRTELAEAIFGARPIDSGDVLVRSKPTRIRSPRDAIRAGIAMSPEDRQHDGLLLPQSVSRNSSLALLPKLFPTGWLNEKRENALASEYAQRLRTAMRSVAQPVRELSGGNQQKVVLAKWLATQPSVLIVDEPTRGVDIGAKAEVHRVMRDLANSGIAILMISSDLPEVLSMSDRILVMRQGRMVCEIPGPEASAESVMLAAAGGTT